ncbi:NAD(P)/FAD-dependent oxidoreductase [Propioniciclava tarda]|uniref:NADH:ubiquinone reductase (non-electrogenic) n=1 Tax=Propioniciclava tarda TaxID=433330 RepID=A0A4Q9KN52_PROTD|nr:NAD(P)/FAD-dependent oxidoreductase [Propioniciclava tarda]TBT95963.1 NAD(P)/FAD-dependent oxidoreductase [Propioniciclava tarda]SMO42039.1 NADH dehydrogenase [Propioniciclava tarda]
MKTFHDSETHHVVIIGSGFGGLFAAQALKRADVNVTLIAKTTHHLFQPLLYQVATGILSEGEIAPATRDVLRNQPNVQVLLGLVWDIDLDNRLVKWRHHNDETVTPYDSLIVATGAGASYFGRDHFATFAPGMKTIDDALELRSRIFWAFEQAELSEDPEQVRRLLTFSVVGAGPTGVEMAGQIRELASKTLRRDFRDIDPSSARVILIDGADQVLPPFGPTLGAKTQRSLESMGVEVMLGAIVTDLDASGLTVKRKDGSTERIDCSCKVWAAGVQASDLGATLARQSGASLDRSGRIAVEPDCSLRGHPEVFVVGDLMNVQGVPGVAQGAIQSAKHVAKIIAARALPEGSGRARAIAAASKPFVYRDKGSMATIAKYRAVVKVGKTELTGFVAWLMWLVLHLLYIAGFKNRVATLLRWVISFLSNARSERVTTNQQLVGRLALEQLGEGASGRLVAGEDITERKPRREA